MGKPRQERLAERKQRIVGRLPKLEEVVRGTFIRVYLECMRPHCKCHTSSRYRHGPYYRISYGKGNRVHHVYVPVAWKGKAKEWTENYRKVWKGIEAISAVNLGLLKVRVGHRRRRGG